MKEWASSQIKGYEDSAQCRFACKRPIVKPFDELLTETDMGLHSGA